MFKPMVLMDAYSLAKIQEDYIFNFRKSNKPQWNALPCNNVGRSFGGENKGTGLLGGKTNLFGQQKDSENVGIVDNQHKSNIPISGSAVLPVQKISNVEMMERRKNGLCYNCDAKWSRGHVCASPRLFLLEGVEHKWIEEPTLLVTRFEYANLFHTVTDWYSAYVSSRVTGLPNRPKLVFVDGHCMAPLEETWKALFSSLRYAKNFSGPVCFRHAILSPLGYETALFKGLSEEINCHGASAHDLWQNPDDKKTARLSEFGEMIRAAFRFPVNRHHVERPVSGPNVLFVRREDYLAHPRHGGKVESRLSNEQEVFDSLKSWALNHKVCNVNLVNGLFAHMSMKEQVRAIQDASVIIGAHGAGLTHIVSAMPKTVILEIISSQYRRPHFALIARWKGLEYHAINLDGSFANPPVVIDKLSSIMRSLGC
ncbi:beta-1,2-xylosyltransferase isoform X2 [Corylus avellana]|uniref:beta-1,2-xylosyltransferase isoform X2 n=1 Tax=Corylus avellana TaxID=13451 RepID=UPI00286B5762|nr:beta-1,2-xylosyltransferase isoform X2 [Corylus avellana]